MTTTSLATLAQALADTTEQLRMTLDFLSIIKEKATTDAIGPETIEWLCGLAIRSGYDHLERAYSEDIRAAMREAGI